MTTQVTSSPIGGTEDWSSCFIGKRTVYLIDTGGTYDLCRDLALYSAGAEDAFASYTDYSEAAAAATAECRR